VSMSMSLLGLAVPVAVAACPQRGAHTALPSAGRPWLAGRLARRWRGWQLESWLQRAAGMSPVDKHRGAIQ
jgi:hypothetical protein